MKTLLVGWWRYDIYEAAFASGLCEAGCSVTRFSLADELPRHWASGLEARLRAGPHVRALNARLLETVKREEPDLLFLYRCDLIRAATLKAVRQAMPRCRIVAFHNDDPFVGLANKLKWRHYLSSLPQCDLVCVYRPRNAEDARRCGARVTMILPPYYVSSRHRPVGVRGADSVRDVIYIGHYEEDDRGELLDYLFRNDVSVRVCGHPSQWRRARKRYEWAREQDISLVWGDAYAEAISASKIALVFLSGMNRDVWTRRCFEIPACGTLMVAPRTPELLNLFAEDREAVYYGSREELLAKVRYYLAHEDERQRIANSGRQRCLRDGHSEIGRARQLLARVSALPPQSHEGRR